MKNLLPLFSAVALLLTLAGGGAAVYAHNAAVASPYETPDRFILSDVDTTTVFSDVTVVKMTNRTTFPASDGFMIPDHGTCKARLDNDRKVLSEGAGPFQGAGFEVRDLTDSKGQTGIVSNFAGKPKNLKICRDDGTYVLATAVTDGESAPVVTLASLRRKA